MVLFLSDHEWHGHSTRASKLRPDTARRSGTIGAVYFPALSHDMALKAHQSRPLRLHKRLAPKRVLLCPAAPVPVDRELPIGAA